MVYLQLAAEYAMGELKELNPSTGPQFPVSNHAQKHHPSMSSAPPSSSSSQKLPRALQRMGTMDRKSAMLTARKELVMALYELGMSFLKGWGVTRDKVVAFCYFKLAADLVRTIPYSSQMDILENCNMSSCSTPQSFFQQKYRAMPIRKMRLRSVSWTALAPKRTRSRQQDTIAWRQHREQHRWAILGSLSPNTTSTALMRLLRRKPSLLRNPVPQGHLWISPNRQYPLLQLMGRHHPRLLTDTHCQQLFTGCCPRD